MRMQNSLPEIMPEVNVAIQFSCRIPLLTYVPNSIKLTVWLQIQSAIPKIHVPFLVNKQLISACAMLLLLLFSLKTAIV